MREATQITFNLLRRLTSEIGVPMERITPYIAHQGQQVPYIIYRVKVSPKGDSFLAPGNLDRVDVMLQITALKFDHLTLITSKIRFAVDKFSGFINGTEIRISNFEDMIGDWNNEKDRYESEINFNFDKPRSIEANLPDISTINI